MNTSFERGDRRTDEWYTPKDLIEKLGTFDLDPCAPSHDFYTAKKMLYKTRRRSFSAMGGAVLCKSTI